MKEDEKDNPDFDDVDIFESIHTLFRRRSKQQQSKINIPPLGGGGTPININYQAILDRATVRGYTQPTQAQQLKQNLLLTTLINAGVYQKLDWLYVTLNNVGLNFGRLNWVNPATFELVSSGTVTHTSNQGVKSDGSSYLDTTWDYNNRINYSQNSACFFAWIFTNGNDGRSVISGNTGVGDRTLNFTTRDGGNRCLQFVVNGPSAITGAGGSMTADDGLQLIQRSDASTVTHYRNDAQTATSGASTSLAPTAIDINLLCRNFGGARDLFFVRDVSVFGCGAGLSAAERTALYNAVAAYVSSPQ